MDGLPTFQILRANVLPEMLISDILDWPRGVE
jgi:hypothetical protein